MRFPRIAPHSLVLLTMLLTLSDPDEVDAQTRKDANFDESKVAAYTLPDPLTMADGTRVTTPEQWREKRHPELLELFREHVFGKSPARHAGTRWEVASTKADALGGKATRKEITVFFTGKAEGPTMTILLYVPSGVKGRVPVFVSPNFKGNHSTNLEPDVAISKRWLETRSGEAAKVVPAEVQRGEQLSRWPMESIIARGYAVATVWYGDIEFDAPTGWKTSLRAALSPQGAETEWKGDDWGAIGAWSYGLSRVLDYLETDDLIDAKRAIVLGHSRLGKTALWAGASDERFAMVISNNSGEGGAALARRNFGETTAIINKSFPHWFCGNYKQYGKAEEKLPVDAHELIALAAPRPVYIASAMEDLWADPKGEFLAGKHAEPVYKLFGKAGLGVEEQPPAEHPVGEIIGYHLRTGKHDVTLYDWERYMDFADRHFGRAAAK